MSSGTDLLVGRFTPPSTPETASARGGAPLRRLSSDGPESVWSMDSVADQLADGRRFRLLTVLDLYTRKCLAIESAPRLKGEDVARVLNRIKLRRGVLKMMHCDNGSDLQSGDGPVGISGRRAHGIFATGESDRQRLRGVIQRDVSRGLSECPSVLFVDRGAADRRDLA
jgi:transposase InsO family protein